MPAMMAGAMALGAGLEFAGGLMASREAGQHRRLARRRGKKALAMARERESVFEALQRGELLKGHAAELAGFKGARRATELGGQAARSTVLSRGKQSEAELMQNIVSRGLVGTSVGAGAISSMQGQTTMQLAAIDQALAQSLAELGLEESGTRGTQARELAALAGQRLGREREMSEALFGLLTA